ncbi:MAG: hypothetical protein ABA06_01425 [Parcubacteria bacterium C7867-001]|nr:MAG: hypothetical protein ABA06_01425 [Parcubacteria bacterium C7867-001]
MDTPFDAERAARSQREILETLSDIHKGLQDKVVNYYWDKAPRDYEEDGKNREYMRTYLREVRGKIENVLSGPLSSQ